MDAGRHGPAVQEDYRQLIETGEELDMPLKQFSSLISCTAGPWKVDMQELSSGSCAHAVQKSLTPQVYEFIQSIQQSGRVDDQAPQKHAALAKEERMIPDIVFQIEELERQLIQLSSKGAQASITTLNTVPVRSSLALLVGPHPGHHVLYPKGLYLSGGSSLRHACWAGDEALWQPAIGELRLPLQNLSCTHDSNAAASCRQTCFSLQGKISLR